MTDAELYNKAADMIEKGWTQRAGARSEKGNSVHPLARNAKSWCLSGALSAVSPLDEGNELHKSTFLRLAENLGFIGHVTAWNDSPGRTQKEVVGILRSAAGRMK